MADGDHALLVDCGDRAALATAIARACDQPGLRRSLAAAARARVETALSFATRVARVEAVYDELMAAKGRAVEVAR